jgi:hypothetical protein
MPPCPLFPAPHFANNVAFQLAARLSGRRRPRDCLECRNLRCFYRLVYALLQLGQVGLDVAGGPSLVWRFGSLQLFLVLVSQDPADGLIPNHPL